MRIRYKSTTTNVATEGERERATLIRWNGTTIGWMTMSNNEYDQQALSLNSLRTSSSSSTGRVGLDLPIVVDAERFAELSLCQSVSQ